jgi:glycosyltransferase involved in cell wall biosynthesis
VTTRLSEPPHSRCLLLVSQRPIDYGGGGSMRWQHLLRTLPRFGWEVAVVTARPNPTANEASTDPRQARLAALRGKVMGTAGDFVRPLFQRAGIQPEAAAPNLVWALTGRRAIARAVTRHSPDILWATAPPQSAIFAAVGVARRLQLPVVAELRDLWAGNPFFDAGGSWLSRFESGALRGADAVVTVTPSCREILLQLHPELTARTRLLPNGFDPSLLGLRSEQRRARGSGHATLIHAGALYGDRSAKSLVHALGRPELRERVRLVLIGAVDPATMDAIHEAPAQLEVLVQPPVSWPEAIRRVADADVAVVINGVGTGGAMALPSKLYEALALAKPVLALTPPGSDTERLLRTLGQDAGVASPENQEAVAAAVTRLLEAPPPPAAPEHLSEYDRDAVARRIVSLLDGLVAAQSAEGVSGRPG